MRKSAFLAIGSILLGCSACSNPVSEAQEKVAFLEANGGSKREICEAQQAVARAHLDRKDAGAYKLSKLTAEMTCSSADMDDSIGAIGVASDLSALKDVTRIDPVSAPAPAPAPASPADQTPIPEVAEQEAPPAVNMCFKDYCPCDTPQGGPDMPLCDQLEAGIEPSVEMMIAGRSMREVRRQLETGDY